MSTHKRKNYRKRRKRRRKKTRRKRGGNDYTGRVILIDFNKNKMKDIIENYPDDIKIQQYFVEGDDGKYLYLQDWPLKEYKDLRLPLNAVKKGLVTIQLVEKKFVVGGRRKKTRKKRGRGKCVSKPKYHDEEEIEKQIAESIKHMKGQSQKLKEIINASTCEDGTIDLKQMLENITKHQKGGRRKKKSRRRR
tara:strand:- start:44 stop:619 length:576 start_codon:yes stop_codon:yes gene_type:complete